MTLNTLTPERAARLAQTVPSARLRPTEATDLQEPRGAYTGQPGFVAEPRDTAEVSALVKACAGLRVGIIPFAGGTGLVAGQVAPEGPVPLLLSLQKMGAIRNLDPAGNTLVAEAGCILADVQTAAQDADRLFPLSLAAEGSCRIGGNLATNAGGIQVLRYGNARDLCLGLEAVLPDGTIHHGLSGLRKDNTGYDLRHLLIGSEGTLGVITAASLRLFARPRERATAFLVVPDPGAAVQLLALAQDISGGLMSGFELISGTGLRFVAQHMPDRRQPFDVPPDWSVLIELGTGPMGGADDILMQILETALSDGLALDGVLAQSQTQRQDFWAVREAIPEANRLVGSVSSHDISVPIPAVPDFIAAASAEVGALGPFEINCFGHIGDGNLHFNVFPAKGNARGDLIQHKRALMDAVHGQVAGFGGSFSAEHGVGRLKVSDLERYGDPAKLAAMRAIKAALDPLGIMNPGAVLRG